MVRKVTGANYGIISWIGQRVTAVIMIVAVIIFLGILVYAGSILTSDISTWQSLFGCKVVKLFFEVTIIALVYHAWVGMRDIWMDYVTGCYRLRLTLHVLTIIWLALCFMYATSIIWF